MQRNVFAPLGMAASRLAAEDLGTWQPYLPSGPRAYGASSLCTTALDYARSLVAMLRPSGADRFQLRSTALAHMLTPHTRVGDQEKLSWGLGRGIQRAEPEDSYWHFGVRRGRTFCFALGYPTEKAGLVVLTSQTLGLGICEDVARAVLGHSAPLPAFRWLLPPERWRADGSRVADLDPGASQLDGPLVS